MGMLALVVLLLPQAAEPPLAPAEVRTVLVTILDREGTPVPDLREEEVALLENGAARDLVRFEPDLRPLVLAVVVDSSEPIGSAYRLNLVEGVTAFLNRLPPQSRYALWTTGDRPTKLVDFTDAPSEALEPLRRVVPRGGNTLLDALVEASADLDHAEGSKTAVVSVTGTGIGFSNYQRSHVVELVAENADLFLSVEFTEPEGAQSRELGAVGQVDYEYVLSGLAERSGGLHLTTMTAMGVGRQLQRIAAELRGHYRLSYATLPDLRQRKIEVQVARPEVRARVAHEIP